jgi:hypothetical protein
MVKLRVVCSNLPGSRFSDSRHPEAEPRGPVYLGIQKDKEVIDQVRGDADSARFDPELRVRRRTDGRPNFLGPFVHGPTEDRFLYLSWGIKQADGRFEMFRRLKVRLGHLDWSVLEEVARSEKSIEVRLDMTDDRGEPLCATPPSWHIEWIVE